MVVIHVCVALEVFFGAVLNVVSNFPMYDVFYFISSLTNIEFCIVYLCVNAVKM